MTTRLSERTQLEEVLRQSRFFLRWIAETGPDLPSRREWASMHRLAEPLVKRLNRALDGLSPLDCRPARGETPTGHDAQCSYHLDQNRSECSCGVST